LRERIGLETGKFMALKAGTHGVQVKTIEFFGG
jgi:hypothetical protein